ncbi:hypothetical protein LZC95_25460 [Pendulispora brunnea]|uniref:Lipoprotein n=1 Tax=Pendulispora brunnea TaxID=2905690 RepID=A0ABZ2KT43_9BACT
MHSGKLGVLFSGIVFSLFIAACATEEPQATDEPSNRSEAVQDIVFPTCADVGTPDLTVTDIPGNCGGVLSYSSPNDQYNHGLFCDSYVVDFANKPVGGFRAGLDHVVHSQGECTGLHASYTVYAYDGTKWVSSGSARTHGVWSSGQFGGCSMQLDSGSSFPVAGTGTKWRVVVRAYEKNCNGDDCYTDKKRVSVSQFGGPPC